MRLNVLNQLIRMGSKRKQELEEVYIEYRAVSDRVIRLQWKDVV